MSRVTTITAANPSPSYGATSYTFPEGYFDRPPKGQRRAHSVSPTKLPDVQTPVVERRVTFPAAFYTPTPGMSEGPTSAGSSVDTLPAEQEAPRRTAWQWIKGLRLFCC